MCATSILERFPSSCPNQHHEAGRHCWNTCCDAASTRVSLECIPLCIFDRYLIKSLWSEHELIRLTFRISQLETLSALGDLSHRQHPVTPRMQRRGCQNQRSSDRHPVRSRNWWRSGARNANEITVCLEKKYLKQTVWFSEVDAQALHAHDARVSRDSLAGIGVSSSLRFR